jgi:LPXTG-motif cell wall-anchored protein
MRKMTGAHTVQVAAGALAAIVLGIIVYRRKQKTA